MNAKRFKAMARTLQISIRFEQAGAFSNLPKREEFIRREVGEYIKRKNLDANDNLEVVITYDQLPFCFPYDRQADSTGRAGAHHGGTSAAAGLHTTFKLMNRTTGLQVGRTRHVVHDANMLEDSELTVVSDGRKLMIFQPRGNKYVAYVT
jgi:hypothetical protein